jgi:hypothetical protein
MIHRNLAAAPAASETSPAPGRRETSPASPATVSLHEIELALGAPDAPELARDIAALVAAGLIEVELDPTGRMRTRLSEA